MLLRVFLVWLISIYPSNIWRQYNYAQFVFFVCTFYKYNWHIANQCKIDVSSFPNPLSTSFSKFMVVNISCIYECFLVSSKMKNKFKSNIMHCSLFLKYFKEFKVSKSLFTAYIYIYIYCLMELFTFHYYFLF